MKKAIIFDLDGTLLNSINDLHIATNYALKVNNLKTRSLNEIKSFIGNGQKELIEKAIGIENLDKYEKVRKDFADFYLLHSTDNSKPYDGIYNMLQALTDRNFKLAIVSNKFQEGVNTLCTPLFGKYMNTFIGENSNINKKPAPDMLYIALEKLNVTTDEIIYVGDSDVDYETAKNANVDFIGVAWGYKGYDFLKSLNIKHIVKTPCELITEIKKIEKK